MSSELEIHEYEEARVGPEHLKRIRPEEIRKGDVLKCTSRFDIHNWGYVFITKAASKVKGKLPRYVAGLGHVFVLKTRSKTTFKPATDATGYWMRERDKVDEMNHASNVTIGYADDDFFIERVFNKTVADQLREFYHMK